ncbi:glutathione peroxidase 2-like [Branchiostoma lanceolatum]|uniref:glutathione peroxidase 2-like n=1 Tax=Branchiostoma lanceolatum TaxID=7740 RepID=UPI00345267D1
MAMMNNYHHSKMDGSWVYANITGPSPVPGHNTISTSTQHVRTFFDLSGQALSGAGAGDIIHFSRYTGKVVLVTNVASACYLTTREFTQLNNLMHLYGLHGLVILAFSCNQFGHSEPFENDEIVKCLRYVRPGPPFQALILLSLNVLDIDDDMNDVNVVRLQPSFQLFVKCDVNGSRTHRVFDFLKDRLPYPSDDTTMLVAESSEITWNPVKRNDITYNFEKFLIGRDGQPYRRYSYKTPPSRLHQDIKRLLGIE